MSVAPAPAERAREIHHRLSRLRVRAIGLGAGAGALGVVMAAWESNATWLLVTAVGGIWALGMTMALGSALRAAEQAERNPAARGPRVAPPVLSAAPKARDTRAFSIPHRFGVSFFAVFAVFMGLLAVVAMTPRNGSVVAGVFIALYAAVMGWAAWRAQTGRVWINGQSVIVPGFFSTTTFAVADVDHVARGTSTGGFVAWPVAILVLRNGRRVQLTPTATWSSRGSQKELDALIQEMNEHLGVRRDDPEQPNPNVADAEDR